jgi:hypothetical protein
VIGGEATLVPGAAYKVGDGTSGVGGKLTLAASAELKVGTGFLSGLSNGETTDGIANLTPGETSSRLVLDYAGTGSANTLASGGSGETFGKITAGATTITGAWTANGVAPGLGDIAIAKDEITVGEGLTLKGGTDGLIEVKSTAGTMKLTVRGVIDLSAAGSVKLTGGVSDIYAAILLKGGAGAGRLVLNSGSSATVKVGGTATVATFLVTDSTGTPGTAATVSNGANPAGLPVDIVVKGAGENATEGVVLNEIGGGANALTNDVQITSALVATNALTIIKGAKVKVPFADSAP